MATSALFTSAKGETLSVEMAEARVSARLTDYLVAYGLGACVGICVYDPKLRVAGMAQIVMPESKRYTAGDLISASKIAGKFADTAIPMLVEEVVRSGGQRSNLRAAFAGGASIFGALKGAGSGLPSSLEIGERNAHAVAAALELQGIPIFGTDTGGSHGRTVLLRVSDGAVIVKPIGGEGRVLAILSRTPEVTLTK